MFNKGDTIRHMNCLDMVIYISRINNINWDSINLHAVYLLERNGSYLGDEDVVIKRKDYGKWKVVNG